MFGSLGIDRVRLTQDGRDAYRAAFCAGCHALHASGNRAHSLLTSRDVTVLTLVLAGLAEEAPVEGRACTAFPLRTIGVRPLPARARALVAALAVATVAAKLRDDVEDGDATLPRRLVLRWLRSADERALESLGALGFPVSLLLELPARQRAAEQRLRPTIDDVAAPSVELGAQIFAHAGLAVGRRELAPLLHEFGASLAAWVYGYDAWLDRAADRRRARFNAWNAAAVHDAAPIAAWLRTALSRARAALAALPLDTSRPDGHGSLLVALLDSLEAKTRRVEPPPRIPAAELRREAGDCEVGCCDLGCGDSACCESADVDPGCAFSCCSPCDLCCFWTEGGKRRQALRRVKRAARDETPASALDRSALVGMRGTALTDLLPEGRVELAKLAFDAIAETGMIPAGAKVMVVGADERRLRVLRVHD